MAKWHGKIGFGVTTQIEPDVYEDRIVEKTYRGEVLRNTQKNQNSGDINDNITLSNKLKVVAEPFICANLPRIKYVTWFGDRWKVSSVLTEYPHLVLEIGDVYNGPGPQ